MYIIGISAFYHDSSACLLKDGKIIYAAQEERFSKKKNDSAFPAQAIRACLDFEGIGIRDIDLVAYYEKPIRKFDRILQSFSDYAPKGFPAFSRAIKGWMGRKLWVSSIIKSEMGYTGNVIYCEHHLSHAAASYYTSGAIKSTLVSVDGVGEKTTALIALGDNGRIVPIKELVYPHSLGLLYSAFTYYCGFKVNSGEYKLMGLAPYGNPIYTDLIKEKVITIHEDGSFELNRRIFAYEYGLRMINRRFVKLLGKPPRKPETEIEQFYKDIAASIQLVTEEIVDKIVRYATSVTGVSHVCLSGGVALNCKSNGKLLVNNPENEFWVFPAPGDSGTSVGAAYLGWYDYLKEPYTPSKLNDVYLGNGNKQVEAKLTEYDIPFRKLETHHLATLIADALTQNKIVGLHRGRMEFGPRALGNRSILANPAHSNMKSKLNRVIKLREDFRPFAPVIAEPYFQEWFDMQKPSPFMQFTCKCLKTDKIPACVHTDGTSRVQTVNSEQNAFLYDVISAFYDRTGIPILINTSLNLRGQPMASDETDSLKAFFNSEIDVLVIENCVVSKDFLKDNKPHFLQTPYAMD